MDRDASGPEGPAALAAPSPGAVADGAAADGAGEALDPTVVATHSYLGGKRCWLARGAFVSAVLSTAGRTDSCRGSTRLLCSSRIQMLTTWRAVQAC